MLHPLKIFLQSFPLYVIIWKIKCKIFKMKIPQLLKWQQPFIGKKGIEIGGPSAIFNARGYLPLYPIIDDLDGVNFSKKTECEGEISEGENYHFGNKTGHQYILEGGKLDSVPNNKYDFLLSCNNLEHIANPIATLLTWKRILKEKGSLLLILPNKIANFDHRRDYTLMQHLVEDYEAQIEENDLTHLEEILKLHDLSRDPKARPFEKFENRCKNNFTNRCIHHHVFSQALLNELAVFCGFEVLMQHSSHTDQFILLEK
jgi:SAM-dependent methyltransferase